MVCLGFEPRAARWQVQTKPRSNGGLIAIKEKIKQLLKKVSSSFSMMPRKFEKLETIFHFIDCSAKPYFATSLCLYVAAFSFEAFSGARSAFSLPKTICYWKGRKRLCDGGMKVNSCDTKVSSHGFKPCLDLKLLSMKG